MSVSFVGPMLDYLGENTDLEQDIEATIPGEGGGVSKFSSLKELSFLFAAQFFGFGVGSLCTAKRLINGDRGAIPIALALVLIGVGLISMPFVCTLTFLPPPTHATYNKHQVTNIWGLYSVFLLTGFCGGFTDAGGFILFDRIWRNDNDPPSKAFRAVQLERMQDIITKFSGTHLFFAMGGLVGVLGLYLISQFADGGGGDYKWYLEGMGIFIASFGILFSFLRVPHEVIDCVLTDEEDNREQEEAKEKEREWEQQQQQQQQIQQQQQQQQQQLLLQQQQPGRERASSKYLKSAKNLSSLYMQRTSRQLLLTEVFCFFLSFGGLVSFGGWVYIFGRNHLHYSQSLATLFNTAFWASLLFGRFIGHASRRYTGNLAPLVVGASGAVSGSLVMILWADDNHWMIGLGSVVIGISVSVFHPNLSRSLLEAQMEGYYSTSFLSTWPTVERAICRIAASLGGENLFLFLFFSNFFFLCRDVHACDGGLVVRGGA